MRVHTVKMSFLPLKAKQFNFPKNNFAKYRSVKLQYLEADCQYDLYVS